MSNNNNFFMGDYKAHKESEKKEILNAKPTESKFRQAGGSVASWLVANNENIVSIGLILFALVVLIISEFGIGGAFWQNVISANTIMLATCVYLLYVNGYRTGSKTANKSEFTVSVKTAYFNLIAEIRTKKIEWMLELFCAEYRREELKFAKTEILLCAGLTEPQIEEFFKFGNIANESNLTEEQKTAIKQAKKLKPINLNKSMLVNSLTAHNERNPIRSAGKIEREKWLGFIFKAVTTIFSCVFVVSLSIKLTTDFSAGAIIYALFQVVVLIVSLFGGISHGYRIKTKNTERLQDVIGVLYEFNEWLERRKKTTEKVENNG